MRVVAQQHAAGRRGRAARRRGAARRRPRSRVPGWAARRCRRSAGVPGSGGWPGPRPWPRRLSALPPSWWLLICLRRRLCEPTAQRKCPVRASPSTSASSSASSPGRSTKSASRNVLLVGVLGGRLRVVGDQAFDGGGLVAGDPEDPAVERAPRTGSCGWPPRGRGAPNRSRTVRTKVMTTSWHCAATAVRTMPHQLVGYSRRMTRSPGGLVAFRDRPAPTYDPRGGMIRRAMLGPCWWNSMPSSGCGRPGARRPGPL